MPRKKKTEEETKTEVVEATAEVKVTAKAAPAEIKAFFDELSLCLNAGTLWQSFLMI